MGKSKSSCKGSARRSIRLRNYSSTSSHHHARTPISEESPDDVNPEEAQVDFLGLIPDFVPNHLRKSNPGVLRMLEKAVRRGEGFLKRLLGLEPSSDQESVEKELFLARGALLEGLDNEDLEILADPLKLISEASNRALDAATENVSAKTNSGKEICSFEFRAKENCEKGDSNCLQIIPYRPLVVSFQQVDLGAIGLSIGTIPNKNGSLGNPEEFVTSANKSCLDFSSKMEDSGGKDFAKKRILQSHEVSMQPVVLEANTQLKEGEEINGNLPQSQVNKIGQLLNLQVPKQRAKIKQHIQKDSVTPEVSNSQQKDKINSTAQGNRKIREEGKINFIPGITKDKYKFSQEEVVEAEEEWKATLIGVMVGGRIPFRDLLHFIEANWKVNQPVMYYKDNGIIAFKFSSDEDCHWVLENGPWTVWGTRNLILKEWHSGLALDWSSFTSDSVWAKVMDIDPIFLSSRRMLDVIANMIGRPISMDRIAREVEKLSYARFLVEVTPEDLKRQEVMLESYNGTIYRHPVEFEWTPRSCEVCNIFGHHTNMCNLSESIKEVSKVPAGPRNWPPKSFKVVVSESVVSKPSGQQQRQALSNLGKNIDQDPSKPVYKRWRPKNPPHKADLQLKETSSSQGVLQLLLKLRIIIPTSPLWRSSLTTRITFVIRGKKRAKINLRRDGLSTDPREKMSMDFL